MYTSIRDVSLFLDLTFTTVHVFLIISLTPGFPVRNSGSMSLSFIYIHSFIIFLIKFIRIYVYS